MRATFLVVEPQPHQGISARKLVLETAQYNVITAYSAADAVELMKNFPKVNAIIINPEVKGLSTAKLIEELKAFNRKAPVIIASANTNRRFAHADEQVSSHDPIELLNLLRAKFGPAGP